MIAFANKDGDFIEAYDESGNRLWSMHTSSNAQIAGNTTRTVSIKDEGYVDVYDENGDKLASTHVDS